MNCKNKRPDWKLFVGQSCDCVISCIRHCGEQRGLFLTLTPVYTIDTPTNRSRTSKPKHKIQRWAEKTLGPRVSPPCYVCRNWSQISSKRAVNVAKHPLRLWVCLQKLRQDTQHLNTFPLHSQSESTAGYIRPRTGKSQLTRALSYILNVFRFQFPAGRDVRRCDGEDRQWVGQTL